MTFTTIIVETLGPVLRLTLNRPERANALNATMLGEINQALDDAAWTKAEIDKWHPLIKEAGIKAE